MPGQETLDRVLTHPELEVLALGSDSLAGEQPSALDVRLNGSLPAFVTNEQAAEAGADVLFLCLGHEAAAAFVAPDDAVVVDLSGAHRLADAGLYERWYGFAHPRAGSAAAGATRCRSCCRRRPAWSRIRAATRPRRCSRCCRSPTRSTVTAS